MANLEFLKSGSNYVNVTTYNLPVKQHVSSHKILIPINKLHSSTYQKTTTIKLRAVQT